MSTESAPPGPESIKDTPGADRRTAHEVTINSPEGADAALLKVRSEGALIREFKVGETVILTSTDTTIKRSDETTGEPFTDDFLQKTKIDGTITMLPYGETEGGPQHGLSRYLKYDTLQSTGNSLELMARDRVKDLNHFKKFTVDNDQLTVVDEAVNTGEKDANLSIGEHFYFAVPKKKLASVKFLDERDAEQSITVRKEVGEVAISKDVSRATYGPPETGPLSDFVEYLEKGKTFYFEGFTGSQDISIPGIGTITISAAALSSLTENTAEPGTPQKVGLLIWHRQEDDTICFEPVAGFSIDPSGQEQTEGIALPPGQMLRLTSSVRLKTAAPKTPEVTPAT